MTDSATSKLLKDKAEASEKIRSQIDKDKKLLERQPTTEHELTVLKRETRKWTDYNKTLFNTLFDESPLPEWHGSVAVFIAKI